MANEYLTDGAIKICVSSDLNRLENGKSLVVEGQMLKTGTASPNKIIKIVNKADINEMFGAGSVLAESLKVAFCQAPSYVDFYALPRLDATNSIKASYLLSFFSENNVILDDGIIAIYHGNKDYVVSVAVSKGDNLVDAVKSLKEEYQDDFMFDVSVVENGKNISLLYEAKNAGTVNNILNPLEDYFFVTPRVKGLSTYLEQITKGSVDPEPNDYVSVFGQCCHYAVALCSPSLKWQKNLTAFLESRWDCDKPMCGGHGYVYNRGTVGEILSSFIGSFVVSKMALSINDPVAPYFKNTAYAAQSVYQASLNPAVAVEGLQKGLLTCILSPESCSSNWDYEEIVHLQGQGFVIAESSVAGYGGYSNPHIFNDVTNYLRDASGRENLTYRSTATTRLVQQVIEEMAIFMNRYIGIPLYKRGTAIPDGRDGVNVNIIKSNIKSWATNQIGLLFSAPILDSDINVFTDFEVAPKCMGQSGLIYIKFLFRPPSSIDRIVANIEPLILDNCNRGGI